MLSLLTKSLAFFASVQSATGLALPHAHHNAVDVVRRADGLVNAVYFVNWFVTMLLLACMCTDI